MSAIRTMYHTQEKWEIKLKGPVKCVREDAWLGDAYYFWDDFKDAEIWGEKSKIKTNYYEIYSAKIDCSNVLDTVFNEEDYRFWFKQVEKAAKKIAELTGKKPSLHEINLYFKERGSWDEVDGICFRIYLKTIIYC